MGIFNNYMEHSNTLCNGWKHGNYIRSLQSPVSHASVWSSYTHIININMHDIQKLEATHIQEHVHGLLINTDTDYISSVYYTCLCGFEPQELDSQDILFRA